MIMLYIIFKGVIHIDNLYGRINIIIHGTMNDYITHVIVNVIII